MSFKMKCPKCESLSYNVERDTRTYATGKAGELVFSCRCGKQLYGDQLTAEYERQKAIWEADPARRAAGAEREQRLRDEESRQEALRQAFEYRRAWVAQRRAGIIGEPLPTPQARPQAPRAAPQSAARVDGVRPLDTRGNRPPAPPLGVNPVAANRAQVAEPVLRQQTREQAESTASTHETHCEWAGCANPRAASSKYCSRACSNKNARLRHSKRKKGSQEVAA